MGDGSQSHRAGFSLAAAIAVVPESRQPEEAVRVDAVRVDALLFEEGAGVPDESGASGDEEVRAAAGGGRGRQRVGQVCAVRREDGFVHERFEFRTEVGGADMDERLRPCLAFPDQGARRGDPDALRDVDDGGTVGRRRDPADRAEEPNGIAGPKGR